MVLNNHSRIRRFLNTNPIVKGPYVSIMRPLLTLAKSVLFSSRNTSYAKQMLKDNLLFSSVEIETVNRCNGVCSFCPVNAHEPQRPYAKMTEELFQKIIVELASLNYDGILNLFSNNEPLLDPRIYDFCDYARKLLPNAFLVICTNGTLLNIEKLKRLAASCDRIVIDNYNDRLVLNKGLPEIQDYVNSDPKLSKIVQFAFRLENEVITTRGGKSPNARKKHQRALSLCILPFCQLVIRPTGDVSLCCNDALGAYTLGNIEKDSLLSVWSSPQYFKIREEMLHNKRRNLNLCNRCDTVFPISDYNRKS